MTSRSVPDTIPLPSGEGEPFSSSAIRNGVLEARDRRQSLIDRHLRFGHSALLTLSLNIPGSDKHRPGSAALFDLFVERLGALFPGLAVLVRECDLLGPFVLLGLEQEPQVVKLSCVGLEESLAAGRLVDLDVYDKDGNQIGRRELGLPQRPCLLCDQPALECIRLKRHTHEELSGRIDELLSDYRLR